MAAQHDDVKARARELHEEIREKQKEMRTLMRELTDHSPLETFTFETANGTVTLDALFGDQDDLIVIHNMGRSCPYCTLWADGLNGVLPYMERRAAVALCSPDSTDVQSEFAEGRGWHFRMISDPDLTFTRAMGYAHDAEPEDGEDEGKTMVMPGFSTFARRDDGSVYRVAHSPFGPGDPYCAVWHMFPLLEDGTDGWQPKFDTRD